MTLVDVDPTKAMMLGQEMNARFGADRAAGVAAGDHDAVARALAHADGLINATPLGMAKYPGIAMPETLSEPRHFVADIVYFPLETALLRAARARGCRVLDGGGMAVFQAVEAFRLFTGLDPDVTRMLGHFQQSTTAG